MKSLEERYIDRVARKAENLAESTNGTVSGRVGTAARLMEEATVAFNGLTDDEREELRAAYGEDGFDGGDGFRSIAEDDTGALKYAGVGVPNPLVTRSVDRPTPVSLSAVEAAQGNGGGSGAWGDGNAAGRAVEAAAGTTGPREAGQSAGVAGAEGWGSAPTGEEAPGDDGKPAVNINMKVPALEKIAADEGVDLEGATNNDERVKRILAKRSEASE